VGRRLAVVFGRQHVDVFHRGGHSWAEVGVDEAVLVDVGDRRVLVVGVVVGLVMVVGVVPVGEGSRR
jgi:hypothetical protein